MTVKEKREREREREREVTNKTYHLIFLFLPRLFIPATYLDAIFPYVIFDAINCSFPFTVTQKQPAFPVTF